MDHTCLVQLNRISSKETQITYVAPLLGLHDQILVAG